ncbi:thiosulfate oxidation carrier protein SoxY [Litorisediminicola beolgyonensis]|uniref:Thiosulfate oxidation carrier protein SoxY n=1 Tax=Litorisediminicola beolgyonensis TaxID=1173614 RepID=A0ABW3ZFK8_9RHOB
MDFTRRDTMAMGAGAAFLALLPFPVSAAVEDAVTEFTGGTEPGEGGVELNAPEIAENGNTVPVEVSAPGASAILLLAAGNPEPVVATFNFGPMAGSQTASTRIRLAKTQDVIAIAKLEDGSFARTTKNVKVTIGGCGG